MRSQSLGHLLRTQADRYGDKAAMIAPGGVTTTYSGLLRHAAGYAGALKSMGISRGSKVAIFADNCPQWAFVDWACNCIGAITVPIYSTLPADQVQYILKDSGAELVACGSVELEGKVGATRAVQFPELDSLSEPHGLSREELDREIDQTQRDDLFTIIYTSGTTGIPKGAMLSHRASLHVIETAVVDIPLYETDTFLSFLPMSHVYERIAGQHLPIRMGATIAYAKSLASLAGDLQRIRPTIMLCVPRFLESFRDRVVDAVEKGSPIRKRIFYAALSQGVRRAQGKFAPLAGILDKIAMSKIRERAGGRLRFFVSGGAALPSQTAEFLMATRLTVLQGYGLTETAGGTCINRPSDNRYWTVGQPLGMDIKIAEDGEILIKGPAIMDGYYNQPEETAAVIDSEGYFHTGDIGEFEGKNLKITDRKKDLIVLGNGKNIAPQKIENKLRESPLIQEVVVFGDGLDCCVALVVPNFEAVRQEGGLAPDSQLSTNDCARKLIKKEIDVRNRTLAPFEYVKRFAVLDEPFTIESGELTPTLKVKRKVVKERFADQIRSLS
jgi:long-chain acyl-CoA synthetase